MIDTLGILDSVTSHALTLGVFETVNGHEPKSRLSTGLTAAVWAQYLGPIPSSGLSVTSAKMVIYVRLYTSMVQEPQDAIDPLVIGATDALMDAYIGDFTLNGLIRAVDVRGMHGTQLEAQAGYITLNATTYRCMTITLPLLINDVWDEEQ